MSAHPPRPMLRPAVPVLWRGTDTLQVGTDPAAVILSGLPTGGADLLELLDGHRTETDVLAAASRIGLSRDDVGEVLRALRGCGALVDGDPTADLPRRLAAGVRQRLAPEFGAARLTAAETSHHPGAVVAARGRCRVVVRGGGRIGVPVAALLAAAGVGHVHVDASGTVEPAEVAPGGHRADDVRRPRATAAADAVRAVAPEADTRPASPGTTPDFVVLARTSRPAVMEALTPEGRRVPHLHVTARGDRAVVGPLVLPGRTACLHCVDLHRCDRDPAWPVLAAQLATAPGELHCAAAVAALAVGVAAVQVLDHLDGGQPEALSASLEVGGPGRLIRRRTWAPHPRCGCIDPALADVG